MSHADPVFDLWLLERYGPHQAEAGEFDADHMHDAYLAGSARVVAIPLNLAAEAVDMLCQMFSEGGATEDAPGWIEELEHVETHGDKFLPIAAAWRKGINCYKPAGSASNVACPGDPVAQGIAHLHEEIADLTSGSVDINECRYQCPAPVADEIEQLRARVNLARHTLRNQTATPEITSTLAALDAALNSGSVPVVDVPETDPLAVKPRSQLPILEALRREYEWRYAPQLNDEDELESAAIAKAAIDEITRLRAALADVAPKMDEQGSGCPRQAWINCDHPACDRRCRFASPPKVGDPQ